MSRYWKYTVILALLCLLIQGATSVSVGNIAITPSTDLVSGQTQVRSTFIINFPSSGGKTFDDGNTLQFSSEMDSPSWTYAIVLDGIENPSKTEIGQNVNINGWLLSYPSKRELSMKVTMEGVAPVVTGSEEKILIAVRELDDRGAKISSTEVVKKKLVINPAQIQVSIGQARSSLSAMRGQIDQLAASGIDVSPLEQKYQDASAAIQSAEATSDYSKAQASLNSANKALSEADVLVRELGIQKAINDVDAEIGQVNALITDFRVNRSMASDARLTPLMLTYDNAANLLSAAKDHLSQKEYDQAVSKAGEARVKADEALNQALDLKKQLDANPFTSVGTMFAGVLAGGIVIIIVVAVIAVIAIVGLILFRRRRKWDELG
ncbi:MAG: hypothetical protein MUC66_04465 [Methanolinea sp.]|jgi:uncharacterized protein (UPF0332 family)|nr:hypothetical protein [Methanolinea sp.]